MSSTTTTPSKAEQARQLTGPQSGRPDLENLRTAILIARQGGQRYYWPKSVWPTLDAASEAMQAEGLSGSLDFTQYRAAGPFHNLGEFIERHGKSKVNPARDAATPEPAKKAPAKKAAAKKAPTGSWASRNPEAVASIPGCIKQGQHPQQFADAQGISLAIAWRLFKAEGWVATGKGGGKVFQFQSAADRRKAQAALETLASFGSPASVIRALQHEAAAK